LDLTPVKVLILIPARYQSSRFPGKPLAPILGQPMIHRVIERCSQAKSKDYQFDVCVVTDNDEIEKSVRSAGYSVKRVDDQTKSGSERAFLAYERFFTKDYQLIINVQGDEPLINPELLLDMTRSHLASDYDVYTIVRPMKKRDDLFTSPDKVKAIFSPDSGRCHYFSRAPIPFSREEVLGDHSWYLHGGVYSFRPHILQNFVNMNEGKYEQRECLEQLRLIENNYTIGAICRDEEFFGVDRPDDIIKLEGVMGEKGIK